MLEQYFVRPDTVDRIRASWLGEPIEAYVTWLAEQGYKPANAHNRVPILVRFAEFARTRGATAWSELPCHVEAFADEWTRVHARNCRTNRARKKVSSEARTPIEQMLRLMLPDFRGRGRPRVVETPFLEAAPGFFAYLREERGLREPSVYHYGHYLRRFEAYLQRIRLYELRDLSPAVLSAFVVDSSSRYTKTSLKGLCGILRVFLRYVHREGIIPYDLSGSVESPQAYRLADIPRSIPWSDVRRMLGVIDRRTPVGKRDYAILLLLVTYGLRGREVAALALDDIDWKSERLRVPERKAGHSTAYPLSSIVGQAIVDYLQHGRPQTAICFTAFLHLRSL